MFENFSDVFASQWIKLAKRDLKKIKKKPRFCLNDAFNIGQIDIEILEVERWITEQEKCNT